MALIKTKSNYQWGNRQSSPQGEESDIDALVRQLQLMIKDIRDDIFQLNPTLFTTLPTAEEDKRGSFVIKEASSVEDLLNVCIRDASAAFLFKKIALNVHTKGADVASAASMTLGNDGDYFDITGTTNITSITIRPVGDEITLQFDGILTLVNGSNLSLADDFITAAGSTIKLRSDGTNWIEISRSPLIVKSAFGVVNASEQSNIAIDTEVTVVFGTERFDIGGDFASNTFTAPVTGRYQLNVSLTLSNIDNAATYAFRITTSNQAYTFSLDPSQFAADITGDYSIAFSVLADMDASDTAIVVVRQGGGTQQTDLDNGLQFFSGFIAN